MKFLISIIIIAFNYYSFTYGKFLWKNENKKLAAFGVFLISFISTIVPIVDLYMRF